MICEVQQPESESHPELEPSVTTSVLAAPSPMRPAPKAKTTKASKSKPVVVATVTPVAQMHTPTQNPAGEAVADVIIEAVAPVPTCSVSDFVELDRLQDGGINAHGARPDLSGAARMGGRVEHRGAAYQTER